VETDYVDLAVTNHELRLPHLSAELLESRLAECERRLAELEGREHRHEYDEQDDIEEIDEV
jgi:hypothetical protein